MKTPEKTQDGKTQSDLDFIMRKYGTFTITANSLKPGECSYIAESLGKPPAKPQHPLARLYDPAVRPYTCGFVRLYRIHMVCTTTVQNPYGIVQP